MLAQVAQNELAMCIPGNWSSTPCSWLYWQKGFLEQDFHNSEFRCLVAEMRWPASGSDQLNPQGRRVLIAMVVRRSAAEPVRHSQPHKAVAGPRILAAGRI
jgi:hypothetical protein